MTSTGPETIERLHYSVHEWCARNSISRSSFYRLVRSGAVRIVKFGAKTLVPADNILPISLPMSLPMSQHEIERCGEVRSGTVTRGKIKKIRGRRDNGTRPGTSL